jgi:4-hydroxy-tetrahydrodipicolinate reductase
MAGIAIFGITGRMGQSLLRVLPENANLRLCGALASGTSPRLGKDAVADGPPCGVTVTADAAQALKEAAVALDFSLAQGVAGHAHACVQAGVALLVGVTGFDTTTRLVLEAAAQNIAVLLAPNTSLAASVMLELAARAARALRPGYRVEIFEAHHRGKRDAPSGTALGLGEAVAQARGEALADADFTALRAGAIVGEHTVSFSGEGERIELTHRVTDRLAFARGALRAGEWLAGQPAGLYGMQHVIAQLAMDSDRAHR